MWLCDMPCAVTLNKDANVITANTANIVRIFRDTDWVRRNSAFIFWAPLSKFEQWGKLLISQSRTILRATRQHKQKAMPLTKVNDIAFAYLGAGAERWEIN